MNRFYIRVTLGVSLLTVPAFIAFAQPWSVRIADSFLRQHPDSITYPDEAKSHKWNYEQGLMLEAFYQMWKYSGNETYLTYFKKNLDYYIADNGTIRTYKQRDFNLDNVAAGKAVVRAYILFHEQKYKKAAELLRQQLSLQPRTPSGGFWHKKIYPNQMWLDGLYMGEPFYVIYATTFHDTAAFADIARQFQLIRQHSLDAKTGLYFHGWDESKQQAWADSVTGCSPSIWGRSVGWLAMAIVDVLDFFPRSNPQYDSLKNMFKDLMSAVLNNRDEQSNLWYQVMTMPKAPGNYLEASASAMFTYALAKGVNKGYLTQKYVPAARASFEGILHSLVSVDDHGTVFLHDVCRVAGLGGKPYRDGSYEYYIGEPRRTNDFKGYGPFLLASIEIEMLPQ